MSAPEETKAPIQDSDSYAKMINFLLSKFLLDMEAVKIKGQILNETAEEIVTEEKLKKIRQVINNN